MAGLLVLCPLGFEPSPLSKPSQVRARVGRNEKKLIGLHVDVQFFPPKACRSYLVPDFKSRISAMSIRNPCKAAPPPRRPIPRGDLSDRLDGSEDVVIK